MPAAPALDRLRTHSRLATLFAPTTLAAAVNKLGFLQADGTVARLEVETFSGDFSNPGLIQSEARLVLTGIGHNTVSAHAKDYAAQRPKTLRPPVLRRSHVPLQPSFAMYLSFVLQVGRFSAYKVTGLTIHQFSRHSQSFGNGRARSISLTAVRSPRVNQDSLLLASFLG